MNKALTVLAECVDIRSGKRFQKGSEFAPAPTPEQAKRLVAAGCLPEEAIDAAKEADVDPAAISRDQINDDGLFDMTVAELKDLAETEEIDLGDATRKDDIVAAIRTARAGK